MKLVTTFDYLPIKTRSFDWGCIDIDTFEAYYDYEVERYTTKCPHGQGATEFEAVASWVEQYLKKMDVSISELMSERETKKPYTFVFDKTKDTWICSVHGEQDGAWLPCWNGCEDGYFDAYEEDPLWYDEGDMETCTICGGAGGWVVCGQCNMKNPDVEF